MELEDESESGLGLSEPQLGVRSAGGAANPAACIITP